MLKKMTKTKTINSLTYGDLYSSIEDMKQTPNYQAAKDIAVLSQQLANTKASIRTWERDVKIFDELGASAAVKDKVYRYLREHPENELSYQEVLMKLEK